MRNWQSSWTNSDLGNKNRDPKTRRSPCTLRFFIVTSPACLCSGSCSACCFLLPWVGRVTKHFQLQETCSTSTPRKDQLGGASCALFEKLLKLFTQTSHMPQVLSQTSGLWRWRVTSCLTVENSTRWSWTNSWTTRAKNGEGDRNRGNILRSRIISLTNFANITNGIRNGSRNTKQGERNYFKST